MGFQVLQLNTNTSMCMCYKYKQIKNNWDAVYTNGGKKYVAQSTSFAHLALHMYRGAICPAHFEALCSVCLVHCGLYSWVLYTLYTWALYSVHLQSLCPVHEGLYPLKLGYLCPVHSEIIKGKGKGINLI